MVRSVAEDDQRGVGVAPVDDHLQRCRFTEAQVPAELRADVQDQQRLLAVDHRRDLRFIATCRTSWKLGEPSKRARRSREALPPSSL